MTTPLNLTPLHNAIRDVPDFPKPGIWVCTLLK